MKRLQLIVILLLTTCTARVWAQQPDTVARDGSSSMLSRVIPAMVMQYDSVDKVIAALNDSLYVARHRNSNDSARIASLTQELDSAYVQQARMRTRMRNLIDLKDSLIASNERYHQQLQERQSLMEEQVKALQEKEALLAEKEALYREAMASSTIDRVKLESELKAKEASIEAKSKEVELLQRDIDSKEVSLKSQRENYTHLLNEKEFYRHLVDSLQKRVTASEMENIRKQEENKYLQQKAKEAEERAAITLNKKKKVRPIQGIAMRMYRTPDWDIRLTPILASDGTYTGKYDKVIRNRNAGDIEFDFVTGASVMLWDLTNFFTPDDKLPDTAQSKKPDFSRFDQKFNYDLGFYVGFGGTKLFKNFYIGPSFRFVDFFYLTIGVNVCEYEVLAEGYTPNQHLDQNLTLDDITAKSWLVKPFISFSIDLDFLSYIKK